MCARQATSWPVARQLLWRPWGAGSRLQSDSSNRSSRPAAMRLDGVIDMVRTYEEGLQIYSGSWTDSARFRLLDQTRRRQQAGLAALVPRRRGPGAGVIMQLLL